MAGYSGTPLSKKLGIGENAKICCIAAPEEYRAWLAPLPFGVEFAAHFDEATDLVHLFTKSRVELQSLLGGLRRTLHPKAAVWVSWPKKSANIASEVTEDVIRELALPIGFVDIKVCAVSEIWSGLKLVVRKELR